LYWWRRGPGTGFRNMEWLERLEHSLSRNKHLPHATYVQLATIRLDGKPANRTVVFRAFHDSSLVFITDKRSEKVAELRQQSWAEACWYFPESREQYRALGQCQTAHMKQGAWGKLCHDLWQNLSEPARQMFTWPTPGMPLEALESFKQSSPETLPYHFVLLVLKPVQVDVLDLNETPHQRKIYTFSNGSWQSEFINP
jgi:pyridoxamine 5'-phosphate oxidase